MERFEEMRHTNSAVVGVPADGGAAVSLAPEPRIATLGWRCAEVLWTRKPEKEDIEIHSMNMLGGFHTEMWSLRNSPVHS